MKDSRVGALGWIGAFAVYVLKIALLNEILIHLTESYRSLLILPPILGRGGVAFHAFLFQPARRAGSDAHAAAVGEGGMGRSFTKGVGLGEVVVSVLLMELLCFRPTVPPALVLPAAALCFWLLWGFVCRAKIGTITGDTMGAGVELAELTGLILILIIVL
jgi:adenosylcobinamide-GDP ribazoletransferase